MAVTLDGLSTGLDSAGLIKQLMAAEAGSQNALRDKAKVATTAAAAYRSVNTRFDALRTAAEALTKAEAFTATKATVVGTDATAVAGTGATPGTLSFTVTRLATARSIISGTTTATPDTVVNGAVSATKGGVTYNFGSNQTMTQLAATINANAASGLQASVVKTAANAYKLMVSAKDTGLAGDFTLAGLGTASGQVAAQDAAISLAGVAIVSPSNTFKDLVPGVAVTVSAVTPAGGPATTVTVARDDDVAVTAMKGLVEAANAALTEIDKQSLTTTTVRGALSGDSGLRQLRDRVLSLVRTSVDADGAGAGTAKSAKDLGLELNRSGRLSFDEARFKTAIAADPAGVRAALVSVPPATNPVTPVESQSPTDPRLGFAQRLLGAAVLATKPVGGLLTTAAQGKDNSVKDLTRRIDDWETRLAVREAAYQRQFSNLEVMIGKMNRQQAWLSGQLSSLPS